MRQVFVVIDTETTGLRPDVDALIEVAAVRFRGDGEVLDSWSSLVNPQVPIPRKITALTGIAPADVAGAPLITQVMPRLISFVRDHPVVGHNVAFDLGFLGRAGFTPLAPAYDTFELASIVLPKMLSYNLENLTKALGLSSPAYHRALADATLTKDLFLALLQRAMELDMETLAEIVRASSKAKWPLYPLFLDLVKEKSRLALVSPQGAAGSIREQLRAKGGLDSLTLALGSAPSPRREEPLTPSETFHPLDVDLLASILEPGGLLEKTFPGYEHRPEQVQMLRAVAAAFNDRQHLIVEAGTGVGKSLSYLLPAIVFAVNNGRRVVVSTNTINLQDQLYHKDIPDLQRVFSDRTAAHLHLPSQFKAVLLKGRSNYLCLRRWAAFRNQESHTPDEMRLLAKILVWLPTTLTGDRAELSLATPGEQAAWSQVCADETCGSDACNTIGRGRCFLGRARRAAESSHLIIVNHALLLSDLTTANRVLPEYDHLIIDESHHLEDEATDQLGFKVDQRGMLAYFDTLSNPAGGETIGRGSPRPGRRPAASLPPPAESDPETATGGFLGGLLAQLSKARVSESHRRDAASYVADAQKGVAQARRQAYDFFNALYRFATAYLERQPGQANPYDVQLRVNSSVRIQPAWSDVEMTWDNTHAALTDLNKALNRLQGVLTSLSRDNPDVEAILDELISLSNRGEEMRHQLQAIISDPAPGAIYWITIGARGGPNDGVITLQSAPLHVGELLSHHLWQQKATVVLTSATLATGDSFHYLTERLGLEDPVELLVGSPFDYKNSTLLYVPEDMPEPNEPYYLKTLTQALIPLAQASQGRMLVLLTSHAAVRAIYSAVSSTLEDEGIRVLGHGIDGTPRQLVDRFKLNPRAVLIGTASLWEGIDVVGEALSVVVIAKLPFAVPTDPVIAARSETFEDAFNQYHVPQAVLKFKQGFGRLIRSKTDRGVVVLLDRRVMTKQYGRVFLKSLPPCTVRQGPLATLPRTAADWLKTTPHG